jgi:serine protease Do
MKFKQVAAIMLISASTAVGSVWTYSRIVDKETYHYENGNVKSSKTQAPVNYAGFSDGMPGTPNSPVDFTQAAVLTIPATVHIKTKTSAKASNNLPRRSPFSDLFGDDWGDMFGDRGMRSMPQQASGSGVIISEDGYIVTNNHVIDGADDITVTLSNRRSFKAKMVGIDASSDLAVLKIDAKGLPFILYGNSDEVKIGQWVLAVGYPLNLETTVTAGIVSAKGRTLEINRRKSESPIESFIQTDAAVNPGNSGGPLVSTDGKLIGINSAIASPTGSYAGYSFTIPVKIVKKVMADLVKFGTVQRAYLGIKYAPEGITDEYKKEQGIIDGEGVYVLETTEEGAAKIAGLKKGDFITKINGVPVYTGADMVGQVATYSPGDKILVSYFRDGKEYNTNLTFKNFSNNTDVVKNSVMDKLGATFETLPKNEAVDMGIKGGVKVKSIKEKGAFTKTRMEENYVITKVNGKEVFNLEDFKKQIDKATGEIKLEGMYPGFEGVFPYKIKSDIE